MTTAKIPSDIPTFLSGFLSEDFLLPEIPSEISHGLHREIEFLRLLSALIPSGISTKTFARSKFLVLLLIFLPFSSRICSDFQSAFHLDTFENFSQVSYHNYSHQKNPKRNSGRSQRRNPLIFFQRENLREILFETS